MMGLQYRSVILAYTNGECQATIQKRITPAAKISAYSIFSKQPACTSGAIYPGVPSLLSYLVFLRVSLSDEKPKSTNFALNLSSRRIFSGLISLCTSPSSWHFCIASMICLNIFLATGSEILSCEIKSNNSPFWSNSVTV